MNSSPSTRAAIVAARDRQMTRLVQSGLTLEVVGQRYGLTRERVRQIITPAVGAVRSWRPLRGDPPPVDRSAGIVRRFWVRVHPDSSGCWLWTGPVGGSGYGACGGRSGNTHRAAYEMVNGPIPAGLTLDHLCRKPLCVNPAHLEAVTPRENILRGFGAAALNARKTHCVRGHPFSEENTRRSLGPNGRTTRACRACASQAAAERYRQRRVGLTISAG